VKDKKDKKDKDKPGLFARLNRALTEVGIQHFDDDLDWDARVKLPEWQLARLKQRHAQRKRQRRPGSRTSHANPDIDTGNNQPTRDER